MTEPVEYLMHCPAPSGLAWCGQPMHGPVPANVPVKVAICLTCINDGAAGIKDELLMAAELVRVRERLRQKLRGMSPADRAAYRENVIAITGASLMDPTSSPGLWGESEILAALYMSAGIRSGLDQLRRTGLRLTYAIVADAVREVEMVTVAMVEGVPT